MALNPESVTKEQRREDEQALAQFLEVNPALRIKAVEVFGISPYTAPEDHGVFSPLLLRDHPDHTEK